MDSHLHLLTNRIMLVMQKHKTVSAFKQSEWRWRASEQMCNESGESIRT
jgi:hypothetical protein